MFALYGKKQRCLWCGKSNRENFKEIVLTIKKAGPQQESAIVCSEKCEQSVFAMCQFIEKNLFSFYTGIALGIVFGLSGLLIPIFGQKILFISLIGVFIIGLTFLIFPFVTPQTVKMFGLRAGMVFGRISGIVLLLIGIILVFHLS
ncbi:MAG: hypothetical protein OEZ31_05295 [Nitrospirota bacterium]|nr:hypothetical protein [Nitrospirota bacterium]